MRTTARVAAVLGVPLALLAAGSSTIAAAPRHSPVKPSAPTMARGGSRRLRHLDRRHRADHASDSRLMDRRRDGAPRRRAERHRHARPAGVPSPADAPGATLQVGTFTSDTDPSIFGIVTTYANQEVVGV